MPVTVIHRKVNLLREQFHNVDKIKISTLDSICSLTIFCRFVNYEDDLYSSSYAFKKRLLLTLS